MSTTIKRLVGLTALAFLAGCSAHRPPTELTDARTAFARASVGHATVMAPEALVEARRALGEAERRQADHAGSDEARHLAYVAHRKVLIAEAKARDAIAATQEAEALEVLTSVKRAQLAQASNTADLLEMKADREAAPASRRRAKEALARLEPFATVHDEPHGTVVRLDDSVLFEGTSAELMPTARARLDRVAVALHEAHAASIVVRGYMDHTADAKHDRDASQRRAEAVRAYLVSRAIREGRIRAEGRGSSDAVVSNASADGQGRNRRIEIVVAAEGAGTTDTKR